MLVRPRQIQLAASRAVDFSSASAAAIEIPAQKIGISTSKGLTIIIWLKMSTQFPNGTNLFQLSAPATGSPTLQANFASSNLFSGSENNTASYVGSFVFAVWCMYAFSWLPNGNITTYQFLRSSWQKGSTTGATTSLVVGSTTTLYIGNSSNVNVGFPAQFGGVSAWSRAMGQMELFTQAQQRAPVSNSQLLTYMPFRDLGTVANDEFTRQSWTKTGAMSETTGPPIPELRAPKVFVPGANFAAPNDPIFYGINA